MQIQHSAQGYGNEYDRWNRALAQWAVHGSSEGTPIYLSVDEPALLTVARRFAGLSCATSDEACNAFRQALISRCVTGNQPRVDLSTLGGTDSDGIPRSVGFLAGMVVAAYEMRDDENADDSTYSSPPAENARFTYGPQLARHPPRPEPHSLRPLYGTHSRIWRSKPGSGRASAARPASGHGPRACRHTPAA